MNVRRIALFFLLIVVMGLAAACAPAGQPVDPPTVETAVPPGEAPPKVTAHPPATPMAVPSVTATSTTLPPRKAIELTVLHTNDSVGFVDPCV